MKKKLNNVIIQNKTIKNHIFFFMNIFHFIFRGDKIGLLPPPNPPPLFIREKNNLKSLTFGFALSYLR